MERLHLTGDGLYPVEYISLYRVTQWYTRNAGEKDESKPANSEQVEELQTQTTNLGLQLRKQLDGTSDNIGTLLYLHDSQVLEHNVDVSI